LSDDAPLRHSGGYQPPIASSQSRHSHMKARRQGVPHDRMRSHSQDAPPWTTTSSRRVARSCLNTRHGFPSRVELCTPGRGTTRDPRTPAGLPCPACMLTVSLYSPHSPGLACLNHRADAHGTGNHPGYARPSRVRPSHQPDAHVAQRDHPSLHPHARPPLPRRRVHRASCPAFSTQKPEAGGYTRAKVFRDSAPSSSGLTGKPFRASHR